MMGVAAAPVAGGQIRSAAETHKDRERREREHANGAGRTNSFPYFRHKRGNHTNSHTHTHTHTLDESSGTEQKILSLALSSIHVVCVLCIQALSYTDTHS